MRFFDAGDHAVGFIAVGQQATGFFAFGQVATGVIAIGQLARGGFVVGQLAVGLVGWGQAGIGVFHAAGMVGVGGRRGLGLVLPLVPSLGRPRVLPAPTELTAVHAGTEGWVDVSLGRDALGLGLFLGPQRLGIKLDRRLQSRADTLTAEGPQRVLAHVKPIGSVLVCERLVYEPPRPFQKKGFWSIAALQGAMLLVLGVVYVAAVGPELGGFLGNLMGVTGPAPVAPVRAPAARPPRRR